MKFLLYIIPLFFFIQVSAQNSSSRISLEPLFYQGLSAQELSNKKLINDKIHTDGKIIFMDIKTDKGNLEYFRIDNYSYYAREKENGITINKGVYELDPLEIVATDTFVSFNPESYEESIEVVNYYHLIKNGTWSETNEKNDIWTGSYVNGLKEGNWISLKNSGYKSHHYKNGILKGIHNPSRDSMEAHLDFIIDKPLVWSTRTAYQTNGEIYKKVWRFEMEPEYQSLDLGVFTLKKDNTFIFDESMNKVKKEIRTEGKGKWSINEKSEIILEFNDGKKDKMTITYWGEGYLGLDNSIK